MKVKILANTYIQLHYAKNRLDKLEHIQHPQRSRALDLMRGEILITLLLWQIPFYSLSLHKVCLSTLLPA